MMQDDEEYSGTVIGKVRPWEENCNEYVVYDDGDLLLVEMEEK
jgi:hypothetical protein